ncbi:hypothetical protein ThidrDRAFT_4722 [Thiorhodococcus drewsii AZ1]|uniref:Uncharacterized protein n=1 Tax=Thiorhodococcus drewsii AZ1 TaxID=765913 RepID=G2E8V8_9GAMM|nr:hypothetical protein [Thiorhodococcus drewsii]EGV27465.1 hypothetical protein ThidrDRAFT_4722 [Thiorhodococcus drewsii AZ1]
MNIFESRDEMVAHLSCLTHFAKVDGTVTDNEREFLTNLSAVYKHRFPQFVQPEVPLAETFDLAPINGRKNKMMLLQDLS